MDAKPFYDSDQTVKLRFYRTSKTAPALTYRTRFSSADWTESKEDQALGLQWSTLKYDKGVPPRPFIPCYKPFGKPEMFFNGCSIKEALLPEGELPAPCLVPHDYADCQQCAHLQKTLIVDMGDSYWNGLVGFPLSGKFELKHIPSHPACFWELNTPDAFFFFEIPATPPGGTVSPALTILSNHVPEVAQWSIAVGRPWDCCCGGDLGLDSLVGLGCGPGGVECVISVTGKYPWCLCPDIVFTAGGSSRTSVFHPPPPDGPNISPHANAQAGGSSSYSLSPSSRPSGDSQAGGSSMVVLG